MEAKMSSSRRKNLQNLIWMRRATSRWTAKWRRQHYYAVAAELILSNKITKSELLNCWQTSPLVGRFADVAGLVILRRRFARTRQLLR
jgi:hypothetical protein